MSIVTSVLNYLARRLGEIAAGFSSLEMERNVAPTRDRRHRAARRH